MATIAEVAEDTFRINLEIPGAPIDVSFFVIRDEEPTLVETGFRRAFPDTFQAVARVIDPATLRYVVVPHLEGDESGALNLFLERAPAAVPAASPIGVATNLSDFAVREPLAVDGHSTLDLGKHRLRFLITPYVHQWDSMLAFDHPTRRPRGAGQRPQRRHARQLPDGGHLPVPGAPGRRPGQDRGGRAHYAGLPPRLGQGRPDHPVPAGAARARRHRRHRMEPDARAAGLSRSRPDGRQLAARRSRPAVPPAARPARLADRRSSRLVHLGCSRSGRPRPVLPGASCRRASIGSLLRGCSTSTDRPLFKPGDTDPNMQGRLFRKA